MNDVLLGFEVGTGEPVRIPIAHTFITGQTQLSGKTTALRAIVGRSGRRALAFVTKRGEQFEGRRIPPYLPREGEHPIHWRMVETILASALGQRTMKYERFWLIQAVKGATSLAGVRANVVRLLSKTKGGRTEEAYTLIREYLDLVVPEMEALAASDTLDLQPGLNVMDLGGVGAQLQALVIRAALERINQHETGVLTVFPEAWEFAPRSRSAPAKDEAINMARKGAVLGNFLLCDSQDLAGVDTVIRQATSVWILGVQRELNELKRTIDSIPAGIKKPKPEQVATLGLGEFFVCWGQHTVKTYAQPAWMSENDARQVAMDPTLKTVARAMREPTPFKPKEVDIVDEKDLKRIEDSMEKAMTRVVHQLPAILAPVVSQKRVINKEEGAPPSSVVRAVDIDEDAMYQRFKGRLSEEAPTLIRVLSVENAIEIKTERRTVECDQTSLQGMIATLLREGFFDQGQAATAARRECARRWNYKGADMRAYEQLDEFTRMGFTTIEQGEKGKLYKSVPIAKARIKAA